MPVILDGLAFVGQVVSQFGRQPPLGQHLLELASKAGLAEDRLGILVLNLGQ